ncbi:hypothetical protein ABBQ38_005639 [Trebouxia sp. C0009 RCD-2024]
MSDSSDDEEVLPKRMCAARARSQLGATEKVLRTLACQLVTNPHYRSAAPMRMYDTQEVQDAVQQEAANKQYLKDHKDKIEAEKTASQKEAAKKKAASAAQACAQFSEIPTRREGLSYGSHHSTKLPLDVWSSILEKLCPPSLSALEGPSTVARYIVNAQLVCHEFHAASAAAWGALAALIQADQMQPCIQCSEDGYSICKQVQTGIARMPTGNCRMLWEEHVANPVRHLSNALHSEVPWDQWKAATTAAASVYVPQKPGKSGNRLRARGVNNTAGSCACGNQAALACQQACCQKCCQGPCARHRC